MSKVSVIIPIYNVEKYLEECLDSVVNQTFKDIEIICVNDGSTDNSLQILEEYALKDNRIYIINQKNRGVSVARNNGIKKAHGEYICFIDPDDIYPTDDILEVLYNTAINNKVLICGGEWADFESGNKILNQNFREIDTDYLFSENKIINFKDYQFPYGFQRFLYKRNFIIENNIYFPLYKRFEDPLFLINAMIKASQFYAIDKITYGYRYGHKKTKWDKKTTHDLLKGLLECFEIASKHGLDKLSNNIFDRLKQHYIRYDLKKHIDYQSCKLLKKMWKYNSLVKDFCIRNKLTITKIIIKPFIRSIFSIRNIETHKTICILGLKIKFKSQKLETKKKIKELQEQINYTQQCVDFQKSDCEKSLLDSYNIIIDLYLDNLISKRQNEKFNKEKYFSNITQSPNYLCIDKSHNYLNILINQNPFEYVKQSFNTDKTIISWEMARWQNNIDTILYSIKQNKNIIFIGDSFLRSINTMADKNAEEKFRKGISFGIDDMGYYYDATRTNRMEQMLNDKSLIITEEQKLRAKKCIDKIVETHLTKYNHQPIFEPNIGRSKVKKVLVVDQSYGDMSIAKGLADESTFKRMLQAAIDENPDADIIVKTHPDTIAGAGGYYKELQPHDNIYTQTEPINPISLIKYVDKVYVCTTQFGFEALMCGKEVHVFGMPFYAGWGLTHDRLKCERRTNTRSLEEVFYIAYIIYSHYVNPEKECCCEIEEAMDYLLKLRDEYFNK